jgi:oxygen-independent coproporphyrinogen-3 oxidase
MDHFALEDDEMALAYREGRLNRNFMGYTVLPGQDFLGCGVSSISYIQGAFFQNHKDLPVYQEMLGQEQWPQERQKVLSADDHHRRAVIHDLMCKFELDTEDWEARFQLKFEEVFGSECEHLEHCIEDGLLVRDERRYEVTELGKLFVRNIAMGFDAYLGKEQRKTRFSKVI